MNLVDILEQKDIDQLGQIFKSLLERANELLTQLRDETEISVQIRFKRIPKGE